MTRIVLPLLLTTFLVPACGTEAARTQPRSAHSQPARRTAAPPPTAPPRATGQLSAKQTAQRMYAAFLRGDLQTFTDYTYRGVIAIMGGRARMIAYIQNVQATLRRSGITPGSATVGEPLKTVKAGQELHALIPLTMELSTPKGTLVLRSHLIGVSGDQGKTWTFVDTSNWSAKKAKQVFPHFNPALKIPPDTKPKLIPR